MTHLSNRIEELTKGIDALLPMLDEDGFELQLGKVSGSEVTVILRATPAACVECLVSDTVLRTILLAELRRRDPGVDSIELVKEGFH